MTEQILKTVITTSEPLDTVTTPEPLAIADIGSLTALSNVANSIDLPTLKTADFAKNYDNLLSMINQLSAIKTLVDTGIKKALHDNYLETGEGTIVAGDHRYTYVPAGTRTGVDSKKLQKEFPDVWTKVVKITNTSPSLRVTVIDPENSDKEGLK